MGPPQRLTGCYTPTSAEPESLAREVESIGRRKERLLNGIRVDKRRPDGLRPFRLESNVVGGCDSFTGSGGCSGSALVELGHTKVLCTVTGPVAASCPAVPSSLLPLSMEQGTLHVEVKYAPTTGYPEHEVEFVKSMTEPSSQVGTSLPYKQFHTFLQSREADASARIATALAAVVPLKPYPKCAILLHITILQDDGSTLGASVTAATLALVQAGIELYDVVATGTVAIVTAGQTERAPSTTMLLADPTLEEMSIADSVITIGMLPNWKEVTLWEQWGEVGAVGLPLETTNEAVNLCRAGCRTTHKFLREHFNRTDQL